MKLSPVWVVYPPPGSTEKEPPDRVAKLMRESDIFLCPTSQSLTHTRARKNASADGARGLTLPGFDREMLSSGGVLADYEKIASATASLASRLNGSSEIKIVSDGGTDLTFDVHDGEWFAEKGMCDKPGDFGNLPGGEVSIAPVDGRGTLVVDGSINTLGKLSSPISMEISDRKIVSMEGKRAKKLEDYISQFGSEGFNVAEIGIGMNPAARLTGKILEDEKVLNTVHIGIGDNSNMGGKTVGKIVSVDMHIDGVITSNPKIFADGERVRPTDYFEN
jgi:leucyl aminopeptidase (aminopeptidase T)